MDIKFLDTPKPIGNFVNVRFTGKYAYISWQGAFNDSGNLITGKVGKDLNLDEAYEVARRVGITILSVINNDLKIMKLRESKEIKIMYDCIMVLPMNILIMIKLFLQHMLMIH